MQARAAGLIAGLLIATSAAAQFPTQKSILNAVTVAATPTHVAAGARLVFDHSSSMSHFTSSSLRFISGVAVSTASSRRWPLGSKK